MLQLNFYNDRSQPAATGFANYNVVISIDYQVVGHAKVEGHCKSDGWRELVRRLVFDEAAPPSEK